MIIQFQGEPYIVTQQDKTTIAVRPADKDKVSILTVWESGEITVVTRRSKWLSERLKSVYGLR